MHRILETVGATPAIVAMVAALAASGIGLGNQGRW
jgi:hypothetical protein